MNHDHTLSGPHDHDHEHPTLPDRAEEIGYHQRLGEAVRALLIEKGVLTADEIRKRHEINDLGTPHQGARMVAKAWVDPAFKARMLKDAKKAAIELGIEVTEAELMAIENTADCHNLIVCTLCSCYPRALLGMPPTWYKSENYRRRVVREPRAVLREFGTVIPDNVTVRVHDSNADMRYVVVPMRPAGTEGWSEEKLAEIITRDTLVGVTLPKAS